MNIARVMIEACEPRLMMSAFYVSTAGSDSNAGTAASPWKTLQHAADVVKAGDSVDVAAGTYQGFNLTSAHSGTASARIVFNAQAGAVINQGNSKTGDGINLEGASYITIQGFTINNPNGLITRGGIRSVTNTGVIIQNNKVDNAAVWDIFTGFSENVIIQNNVASNAQQQHGIYTSNSADNPIIRGNIVFGNHNCGIHMNGDVSQGGDGIISGALVENNILYNNGVNGGSAINADGVQNSVFRNNLLYNNYANGISLFQMDGGAPSKGNLVENNTIDMASNSRWCLNIVDGSTNNTVRNNIMYNQNTGHGAITIDSASRSGLVSDYNTIINNRMDNGGTYQTLAQWQSSTGQDLHSNVTTAGATWVNPTGRDYHLLSSATSVDKGTSTAAPLTDIEGKARPSGASFDIGSYEYQNGTAPAPTPAPTTYSTSSGLTLSASSTTYGQAVTLTAKISSSGGTPTGTVNFMDGSTLIGSASLSSGTASFSTSALAAGTHSLTAVYAGTSTYTSSTSAAAALTVAAPTTTVTAAATSSALNLSASTITTGQPVTLTARITSASGTPTGTVKFVDGTTTLATASLNNGTASFTTSSLAAGTHSLKVVYVATTAYGASTSATATLSVVSATPIPTTGGGIFTTNGDIGSPALKGSSSYDSSTGIYTVKGAGKDIWSTSDQFQYDYTTQTGDAVMIARVNSMTKTYGWAKAGLMYRASSAANAAFVDIMVTPSNGVSFQYRSATGGLSTSYAVTGVKAPAWVKLVRSGNSYSGFYSIDGVTWKQVGPTVTLNNIGTTALAGLAVTSHNTSAVCTAQFSNVSLTGGSGATASTSLTI